MCTEKIYSGEKESEKSHLYIPFYHSLIHSVSICWAFSKSQHQADSRTECNDQRDDLASVLLHSPRLPLSKIRKKTSGGENFDNFQKAWLQG